MTTQWHRISSWTRAFNCYNRALTNIEQHGNSSEHQTKTVKTKHQVALRAVRSRPSMIRALVLVSPAVLNPLDSKFVMGRDPNANLFTPIANLRTRVETTAKIAAFNLQVIILPFCPPSFMMTGIIPR